SLRPFVPYPFEIDMYEDRAWVSIVLFQTTHSRLRFMPAALSFPAFYQMNIRTYVRFGDERGVCFFNIHVSNPIVQMGGEMVRMPFTTADMTMQNKKRKTFFEANQLFQHPQSKL